MSSPTTPICVSDTFHFSHYYWRNHDDAEENPNSSSDEETEVVYHKPKEVKSDDIKLKFYSQVMDDGSNNIHFGFLGG